MSSIPVLSFMVGVRRIGSTFRMLVAGVAGTLAVALTVPVQIWALTPGQIQPGQVPRSQPAPARPAASPAPISSPDQAHGLAQGLPSTRGAGRFVVVLDAAHGGEDGGGQIGDSVAEKTVTLALSVRLRSLLTARGFQVVTTREGNVNLDSTTRAQIANRAVLPAGSAACVSFHATESGSGVHIFVSSLAPVNQTGRFLAWKTAQAAFVTRSLKLAGTINSALEHTSVEGGKSADGSSAGPVPATVGRASLPGVDSMACPAVAVEVAPIRADDRKVVTEVTDEDYQTQIVEAMAAALLEWRTDQDVAAQNEGRLP